MIKYRVEEELLFAKYYAEKLDDALTSAILDAGCVKNADEATHLSQFFWRLVDASIEDDKNETKVPWTESSQFLSEKLMYSLSGYLENAGFENEWEEVSDQQDT